MRALWYKSSAAQLSCIAVYSGLKMLKLAVFACLLVVSYAQPTPSPPDIPETFMSKYNATVKRYREPGPPEEFYGVWDRSMEMKSYMEELRSMRDRELVEERLALFTTHMDYGVYRDRESKELKCEKHEIPTSVEFPMYWDWLKMAHYHEFKNPRDNKTYDAWTEVHDGESRTLFVAAMERNKPLGMMFRDRDREEERRFTSFEAMAPPSTVFEVPSACNMPPQELGNNNHPRPPRPHH